MSMPMLAGVGLLVVCSSSSAAAMMMGGGEETPAASTTTTPVVKKYRYVRIAKTEDVADWNQRYINLHEVYVYDAAGTNVALNKTVTGHENLDAHYAGLVPNLVDGDDTTLAHTGRGVHDETQPEKQWLQIDLGAEIDIKSVKIVDRAGYGGRLDKVKVILMKAATPSTTDDVSTPALTTADAAVGLIHSYDFTTKTWTHS